MINEKTVTVKMRRIDLCKLMTACTHLNFEFQDEAKSTKDEEVKRERERSARMWGALHDMLKAQLDDFDEKHKDDIY